MHLEADVCLVSHICMAEPHMAATMILVEMSKLLQ